MAATSALRAGVPAPNSAAEDESIVYKDKSKSAKESKRTNGGDETIQGSSGGGDVKKKPGKSIFKHVKRADNNVMKNPMLVERSNLLNVAKLCIKNLIESALAESRTLDNEDIPLQQFFVVLEHILSHGLKSRKTFLDKKKSFWGALESLEKITSEADEITDSVRNLPGIKTSLGRGRAWLRLALMQKNLADYFKALLERKDILSEWYEPGALLLDEEAAVVAGLLVGLNVIDCNLCLKGDDLDSAPSVIDFSMYLKDGNYLEKLQDSSSGEAAEVNLTALLDQKNYLEEHNRHLTSQVTVLQGKIKSLEQNSNQSKEELAVANNNILSIQAENDRLKVENDAMKREVRHKLQIVRADMDVERETYNTSRIGLNELYGEAKDKLQLEAQVREDVEQELKLQVSLKTEMEMAMRLLEKDIHEKQDTVISLRKQLGDIKTINIDLYTRLQTTDGSLQYKSELVSKLEEKTEQMGATIALMEERLKKLEKEKQTALETSRKLGQQIAVRDAKRAGLETDLKIEREWRATLQKDLGREKELVMQLQQQVKDAKKLQEDLNEVTNKHMRLREECTGQEQALIEMGDKLSTSRLQMENMQEAVQSLDKRVWADDKEITNCMQCEKIFSVARRKHHCRNCGGIFCNACSENVMPLPAFAKPVRCCDRCHTELLQRYSVS